MTELKINTEPSLVYMWEDGRILMSINRDGTVTGEIEGASEAGRAFIGSIRKEVTAILHEAHTPSEAHLSNVSINGVRQTWQQLYEREHEAHLELQGYRGMLSDLDRNANGRHHGDYDSFVPGGISEGNPRLTTGDVIGYDIGGRAYVVPEPRDRGTLSAWGPVAVTEQGENR